MHALCVCMGGGGGGGGGSLVPIYSLDADQTKRVPILMHMNVVGCSWSSCTLRKHADAINSDFSRLKKMTIFS